jgi:DedD protein
MDIALKQRLVGASVLIALAVVVLPMLLGGRPEQAAQQSQKIELPPQPAELDFQTRRYPIGEAPAAAAPAPGATTSPALSAANSPVNAPANHSANHSANPPAAPAAEADGGAAADTPADTSDNTPAAVAHVEVPPRDFQDALQDDPVVPPDAAADLAGVPPAAEPPPAEPAIPAASLAPPPAPAGSGRYVVQVASFGSVANAERLSATLRGHGYGVLGDTVQSDVGTLHRVRIGPYASEAEANAAAARVSKQVPEVKPRVVDLQPEAAAQVTTPADPLVRWVVQVGSFAAADNADKLVERLRGEGLSAYREAVSSAGSTIYRVRVGPFLERDEAIRVDGLIGERLSLDGVVMSAD